MTTLLKLVVIGTILVGVAHGASLATADAEKTNCELADGFKALSCAAKPLRPTYHPSGTTVVPLPTLLMSPENAVRRRATGRNAPKIGIDYKMQLMRRRMRMKKKR
ncbi:hypothetical protein B9Z55_016839 [Caenorhabditis nigoni]|uniref:Uncharacterized protein n=1 Tax=Caenorhabditis nigoni TaxID=1611254 RepID=A0A2G5T6H2_9PELO|nr:hypothetical protein B9Z55_016839 [Caenorhabditis nigoni]